MVTSKIHIQFHISTHMAIGDRLVHTRLFARLPAEWHHHLHYWLVLQAAQVQVAQRTSIIMLSDTRKPATAATYRVKQNDIWQLGVCWCYVSSGAIWPSMLNIIEAVLLFVLWLVVVYYLFNSPQVAMSVQYVLCEGNYQPSRWILMIITTNQSTR